MIPWSKVKLWKEVVIVYFKEISRNSPGETEESHEPPLQGQPVARSRFEQRICRIQVKSVNATPTYRYASVK